MNILIVQGSDNQPSNIDKILSMIGTPSKNIQKLNDQISTNNWLKSNSPDLILLDTENTGNIDFPFSLLRKKTPILKTGKKDEPIQAFQSSQQQPLKYINQLNSSDLSEYLSKLIHLLENQLGKIPKLVLPTTEGIEFVAIKDILRCQSNGGYTDIFLVGNQKKEIITKKIIEVEKMLEKFPFFRIHRSHLINVNYVRSFKRSSATVILDNGEDLPVSRRKKDDFLAYLSSF